MNVKRIYESLKGTWNIKRTLGSHGVITGRAKFTISSDNNTMLLYREDFNLENFHNSSLYSYQEYKYSYINGQIVKYFQDEKVFYPLKFLNNNRRAYGIHKCRLDIYEAIYDFYDEVNFKLEYKVNGSFKNYIIQTMFDKVSNY